MNQNIKGWHSRGYIPHFDQPNLVQLITLRLHDAVPEALIEEWKKELSWGKRVSADDPRQAALRKRIEKYEDAGHGACWLRDEHIAEIVERAILYFDGNRYRIIAWCIMPNHVHVIIELREGYPLAIIMHSWKSFTGHKANQWLGRSGTFWFREYHDRFIRDSEHFERAVEYVENNPVRAGLVDRKAQWRWSSAWKRRLGSA